MIDDEFGDAVRKAMTKTAADIMQILIGGDDLYSVVKCHLYIESYMTEAIEGYVSEPNLMGIDRMPFAQKARLAGALGIIESEELGAVLQFNKLRNRFVHNLHAQLTEDDVESLLRSVPVKLRASVAEASERLASQIATEVRPAEHLFGFAAVAACLIGRMSAKRDIFAELRNRLTPEQYAHMQYILTGRRDPAGTREEPGEA